MHFQVQNVRAKSGIVINNTKFVHVFRLFHAVILFCCVALSLWGESLLCDVIMESLKIPRAPPLQPNSAKLSKIN